MYKTIFALFLLVATGCCTDTLEPPVEKYVNGSVTKVELIPEDSSNAYILLHYENKVVKLRSHYSEFFEIPLNQEINIFYDDKNYITKIVERDKRIQQ